MALHQSTLEFITANGIEIIPLEIDLDYSFWQADDILAAILPDELVQDSPAGFTMVGHIAHMNLRVEYLPFKHTIGQVILDKNTSIRTVVNKLDTIDSVFRNFQMEILAGEHDLIAEQHESGCRFRFDFSKVYWNSRLHTEHERLVAMFNEGDAVCDVMAGVGPFAIPAAKRRVLVVANDLNPASFDALLDNIELNKVSQFVVPTRLDGRACIRSSLRLLESRAEIEGHITVHQKRASRNKPKSEEEKKKRSQEQQPKVIPIPRYFHHYIMNLPATAIEFLDAFRGLYHKKGKTTPLPIIHVHCFTKFTGEEAVEDLRSRIGHAMQCEIAPNQIAFHLVRKVAPSKDMYCCSFALPSEVAFAAAVDDQI